MREGKRDERTMRERRREGGREWAGEILPSAPSFFGGCARGPRTAPRPRPDGPIVGPTVPSAPARRPRSRNFKRFDRFSSFWPLRTQNLAGKGTPRLLAMGGRAGFDPSNPLDSRCKKPLVQARLQNSPILTPRSGLLRRGDKTLTSG